MGFARRGTVIAGSKDAVIARHQHSANVGTRTGRPHRHSLCDTGEVRIPIRSFTSHTTPLPLLRRLERAKRPTQVRGYLVVVARMGIAANGSPVRDRDQGEHADPDNRCQHPDPHFAIARNSGVARIFLIP